MFTSAILDLRLQDTWDPGRLTAEAFRWPTADPEVPLRELASRVVPRSLAEAGSPVITPASIDPDTGSIRQRNRKYQGSVFQVGSELRAGDVLVPRIGIGPALFVSDRHRGALVSTRFSALRGVDTTLGLWIWGVLSSQSGARLRSNLAQGAAVTTIDVGSLLETAIPLPPAERLHRLATDLRVLANATGLQEEEVAETWWQTADLRQMEWRIALATPDPSILTAGEPLANFCGEIVRGRSTRELAIETEAPGFVPVADVSMLGGKPPRRWVPEEQGKAVIALPGDLLVAALGSLPHARVVDSPVAADTHVLVLRLRNPALGPALARLLNGPDAYRVRQMFASGSTIPSISARDLGRIPVPESALEQFEAPVVQVPLAERLEQVLWQS